MHTWRPEDPETVPVRGGRRAGHVLVAGSALILVALAVSAAGWPPLGGSAVTAVLAALGLSVSGVLVLLGPRTTACAARRAVLAGLLQVALAAAAWSVWGA